MIRNLGEISTTEALRHIGVTHVKGVHYGCRRLTTDTGGDLGEMHVMEATAFLRRADAAA